MSSIGTYYSALCFIPISLLLSRPEVILLARLGSVVWYPATALSLALMLAISPWYFFLGCFSDTLASALFYHQPLKSFSELLGTVAPSGCYAAAAYLLRGPLRIDLGLRRQRDVTPLPVCHLRGGIRRPPSGGCRPGSGRHNSLDRLLELRPGVVFRRLASDALALRPFFSSMCSPAFARDYLAESMGDHHRSAGAGPTEPLSVAWVGNNGPGLRDLACAIHHIRAQVGGARALLSELHSDYLDCHAPGHQAGCHRIAGVEFRGRDCDEFVSSGAPLIIKSPSSCWWFPPSV